MFGGSRRGARRIGRPARGVFLGLTVALLLPQGGADAYRFLQYHRNKDVPSARDAQLWSSTHWGFDDSLAWVVADDPGWTAGWEGRYGEWIPAPFRNRGDVLSAVGEALAAWSRIETADIRWHVSGLRPGAEARLDGLNAITVDPDAGVAAYARGWARSSQVNNDWHLVECDIGLDPETAVGLGQSDLSILIHEFGHCVGLDHAAVAPHSFWAGYLDAPAGGGALGAWGAAPQMSYGVTPRNGLTPDDVVGASLLRPARGWLRTRGAIAGEITVEGEPAPFASVWAIRTSDAATGAGIGGFADAEGRFLIEGLAPGIYLIRAGPRINTRAHYFPGGERIHDLRDGFALDPVSVLPGLRTDGVAVDLRWGRAGPNRSSAGAREAVPHRFAPVPGGEAAWVRHRRAATQNAACPGVTVRAEPPAPAGNRAPDGRRSQLVTTVTVERSPEAAGVTLDLLDPYASFVWDDPPVSATRITAWRTEILETVVRHAFDIEWPRETPNLPFDLSVRNSDLAIGFHGGPCSGSPRLTCAAAGCRFAP